MTSVVLNAIFQYIEEVDKSAIVQRGIDIVAVCRVTSRRHGGVNGPSGRVRKIPLQPTIDPVWITNRRQIIKFIVLNRKVSKSTFLR